MNLRKRRRSDPVLTKLKGIIDDNWTETVLQHQLTGESIHSLLPKVDEKVLSICHKILERRTTCEGTCKGLPTALMPQGLDPIHIERFSTMLIDETRLVFEHNLILKSIQGEDVTVSRHSPNIELLGDETYNIFVKHIVQFCALIILHCAIKSMVKVKPNDEVKDSELNTFITPILEQNRTDKHQQQDSKAAKNQTSISLQNFVPAASRGLMPLPAHESIESGADVDHAVVLKAASLSTEEQHESIRSYMGDAKFQELLKRAALAKELP